MNSPLDFRNVAAPPCLTDALAVTRGPATAAAANSSRASLSSTGMGGDSSPANSSLLAGEAAAETGASGEQKGEHISELARSLATEGDSIAALFGWQLATKPGHVSCALCGRCLPFDCDDSNNNNAEHRTSLSAAADGNPTNGLAAQLGAKENETESSEACDTEGAPPEAKRLRLKAPFDAEAAHRWFCPWVRADAAAAAPASRPTSKYTEKETAGENKVTALPGWQRLLNALLAAPPTSPQGALRAAGSGQAKEQSSTPASSVLSRAEALAALASARAVLRNI